VPERPAEVTAEVLGRGSIYTLGTAAPVLAQLAVTPFVARLLTETTGYGQVAVALVVLQVTMILASLGLPSVITRQALLASGGIPGARSLFRRGAALTAVVIAAAAAVTPVATWAVPGTTTPTWLLSVLAAGAFVVVENAQALLRAQDRAGAFVALSAVASLGGPLLGLVLLLGVDRTPATYLAGLAAGYLLAAGLAALQCRGPATHRPGDLGAALRMGLPVLPHLVALYLATGALVVLATARFGSAAAGRLQLAILIGVAPTVLVGALNNSWAPAVYRLPQDRRGAAVEHTAADLTVLAALAAGGVTALAPWLLRLLADARYSPDELVGAVAVVSLGSLFAVGYLANVHLVFASGRTFGLALATPTALVVGLLVAALAGVGSLTGTAWGYPATYAALAVLVAGLRRRAGGPGWREARLLPALLGGVVLVGLLAALPSSGAGAVARLGAAAVIAVVAALRLRRLLRPGVAARPA